LHDHAETCFDPTMTPSRTAEPILPDGAELAALREIVQLAAGASTWDELMQLIVDRSTDAMRAEVLPSGRGSPVWRRASEGRS
jgi:hypothetical protein